MVRENNNKNIISFIIYLKNKINKLNFFSPFSAHKNMKVLINTVVKLGNLPDKCSVDILTSNFFNIHGLIDNFPSKCDGEH